MDGVCSALSPASDALLKLSSCSTTDTTYTIATAGEEGFLSILPVYLDHVLYPTLTSSGFVTEVHNINGKGEDSGVVRCSGLLDCLRTRADTLPMLQVYAEMSGRENGSGDLMALRCVPLEEREC